MNHLCSSIPDTAAWQILRGPVLGVSREWPLLEFLLTQALKGERRSRARTRRKMTALGTSPIYSQIARGPNHTIGICTDEYHASSARSDGPALRQFHLAQPFVG